LLSVLPRKRQAKRFRIPELLGPAGSYIRVTVKSTAAVICGAGWSVAAGLPLTRDLFSGPITTTSRRAAERIRVVYDGYADWLRRHPDEGPEHFLAALHRNWFGRIPWPSAVEAIQVRLSQPQLLDVRAWTNLRYGQRITNPTYCSAHTAFWMDLAEHYDLVLVMTTNYDILIERSLRHRTMKRPSLPGFHYAGLEGIPAIGTALPFSATNDRDRSITPDGHVPLAKVHGSLNWIRKGNTIAIYQDLRVVFRQAGASAIVPPLTEKEMPRWLEPIWRQAKQGLTVASVWIVVGYSLPAYDIGLRDLISSAAHEGAVEQIYVHDPSAAALTATWRGIAPTATVYPRPGL
jgi:hypothetical protein